MTAVMPKRRRAALSLFQALDATVMILIWNLGGTALVLAAGYTAA
jgi:hypothetical protein